MKMTKMAQALFLASILVNLIGAEVVSPPSVLDICEPNTGSLSCQSGYIKVVSAFFGRTNNNTCPVPGWMSNTNCKLDLTAKIGALCDNQKDCLINATLAFAGSDPCVATVKYTEVSYICLQPQHAVDFCKDSNSANIRCINGTIKVESAFYGRTSYTICPAPHMLTNNCTLNLTTKMGTLCNGKSDCLITSSLSSNGTDPCIGTDKYTEVAYSCN